MNQYSKIALITIIATCSFHISNCQVLNYKDLFTLQKNGLTYVDNYLSKKGWEFNSSTVKEAAEYFDYSMVSWSYNKNTWNNKAEGWFYLYESEGYGNIISFQTTRSTYNGLKTHTADVGLKSSSTEATDGGLTSVYRKGDIEVRFTVSEKKDEYDYDNETYYTITIWNMKEFQRKLADIALAEELRKAEEERLAELKKQEEERLAEIKRKEEEERKRKEEQRRKEEEARKLREFLKERNSTIYDYEETNNRDFSNLESALIGEVKESVSYEDAIVSINLVYVIDTLGKTEFKSQINNSTNDELAQQIIYIAQKHKLEPAYLKGYKVKAKAETKITVELENRKFQITKNHKGIKISDSQSNYTKEINDLLNSGPVGKYKVSIQKRKLNSSDFSKNQIAKFKRIDGPGNAFLSLLVPGLGDAKVNGGKGGLLGSPVATSLVVYGSILYGVSVKIASNVEYDNYLNATTQIEMDQYYDRANSLHKQSLIFIGIGSAIWISDIIWVAVKGAQNSKNNKSFKNQFSINYNSNSDTFLMGYSLNF